MITIKLNGRELSVAEGKTIYEVCKDEGISIPTFCHDERLKPEGSCRICIVEIARGKLVPACVHAVTEGIDIQTHSPKVIKMRRTILELLISNHDASCQSCEKAGDCLLQNYAYEYGIDLHRFAGEKRKPDYVFSNKFFYLNQSKCILCGKCARICSQLQGQNVWAMTNRGFETEINTPFGGDMEEGNCVSCGNCVSNCPVGALMPKTSDRFKAWEVTKHKTTCSYCGVGCQMYLLLKDNKVVGVEPAKNGVNHGLLCVKGKFAYHFINHPDRLKTPLIKKNGTFVEASWDEAYSRIKEKLLEIKSTHGADSIGILASARMTNEENYLMQKFARAVIGTNNVDHCARL